MISNLLGSVIKIKNSKVLLLIYLLLFKLNHYNKLLIYLLFCYSNYQVILFNL